MFCAWTAFYLIAVLVHDVLAGDAGGNRAARAARAGAPDGDIKEPDRLIAPGLDAAVFYWSFLAGDRRDHLRDAVPALVLAAAAAATPGFWDWSLDPPLVLIVDAGAALLDRQPAHRHPGAHARPPSAGAAHRLLRRAWPSLAIALASPIDPLSEQLFWVHMIQHVLLMLVAAPLLVLARPWIRLWRCAAAERPAMARARALSKDRAGARRCGPPPRSLGAPARGFVLFSVVLLGWHVPALFDATLSIRARCTRSSTRCSSCTAVLLFWKQVIPSPPLRIRLGDDPARALRRRGDDRQLGARGRAGPRPEPAVRPLRPAQAAARGGISALADQQLAAGVMWVPGSITFVIVIFVYIHRWLAPPAPGSTRTPRLASGH